MPPTQWNIQTIPRPQNTFLILRLHRLRPLLHELYSPSIHTSSIILTPPFVRLERCDSCDVNEGGIGNVVAAGVDSAGVEKVALVGSVETDVFVADDMG